MKIMFIHPDFPETWSDDSIFPFGYASLDAVLTRQGHEVEILIPSTSHLSVNDLPERIKHSKAELFALGGLFPYMPVIEKAVAKIKAVRPDAKIVLGGQMVTYSPQLVLKKTGVDFCIAGEGEVALPKLVDCLEKGKDYSNISGLVFQRNGKIIDNGLGETMPLEEIPMPNWDKFPMDYYNRSPWFLPSWSRTKQQIVVAWLLSRGCPMKCNFCASGSATRYKSVEQAMRELREINDRFHPDRILFCDNFLMRNRR
ncbi:MAG: cobalamin-dependent protein [Candidatus Brocadiales bacterium]|nr:cobalamin-dependent protein [Candidatus Brocadiales bacterium]